MKTPLPRRNAAVLALVLAPVAVLLAGCNTSHLGAAAIVEDEPITVEQLQDTTQEYLRVVPSFDSGEAQAQILNSLIRSEVIEEAARRAGVSVTDAEVARQRDEILAQVGGRKKLVQALAQGENAQVIPPSRIDDAVRENILVNKVVEKVSGGQDPNSPEVAQQVNKAFVDASRSLDIEVNPRYGTWNPRQATLNPLISGGLSKSLTELTRAAERQ